MLQHTIYIQSGVHFTIFVVWVRLLTTTTREGNNFVWITLLPNFYIGILTIFWLNYFNKCITSTFDNIVQQDYVHFFLWAIIVLPPLSMVVVLGFTQHFCWVNCWMEDFLVDFLKFRTTLCGFFSFMRGGFHIFPSIYMRKRYELSSFDVGCDVIFSSFFHDAFTTGLLCVCFGCNRLLAIFHAVIGVVWKPL